MSGLIQRELYDRVVAERDALRERLAWWEGVFAEPEWGQALGLSRQQGRLLSALHKRAPAVMRMAEGLEAIRHRKQELCAEDLRVRISKVRGALAHCGGKPGWIVTHWGVGYSLSPEGVAWVDSVIARHKRRAA